MILNGIIGRRVTIFRLARLEEGQSIETGLLTIIAMGDDEYVARTGL